MKNQTAHFTTPEEKDRTERKVIVKYFTNIWRKQLAIPSTSRISVTHVNKDTPDVSGTDVYEFKVEREGRIDTRRMSIVTIGESGGTKTRSSKSRCYKIVYDDLVVVKVPPIPITTFHEYLDSIALEGQIAVRLDPEIEFVAPGVTAIMRRLFPLKNVADLSLPEMEQHYIAWLKKHPQHQEYLKIEGAYAYFMDLSRYSFLSQVVEKLHDEAAYREIIGQDILQSNDLLWDVLGFEGKYGSENLSSCFNMNKLYSDFETELKGLFKKHEILPTVSAYEKQEWFLKHLAYMEVESKDNDFSPQFISELNALLYSVLESKKDQVEEFRRCVRAYVGGAIFEQNKPQMAGIIANILNLLAWLKTRGVAIRDLKPDNLFVVGDATKNPLYLASVDESSLGLIDFETAVDIHFDNPAAISQPLLAGTPSYATPSHLFTNDVIQKLLGRLPRILWLQDWQAGIGMAYNIVTGDTLFEETRKILGGIKGFIRQAMVQKKPLEQAFIKGSQLFWGSADYEFKNKTAKNKSLLKSVEVAIPPEARRMICDVIEEEQKQIAMLIKKYVMSQNIFSNDKSRKNLMQCSLSETRRKLAIWREGKNIPKTKPEIRKKIIMLLTRLEEMKSKWDYYKGISAAVGRPSPKLTAYDAIEFMYSIVSSAMYRREWGPLTRPKNGIASDAADPQNEDTIVYEATISYETSL